MMVIGISSGTRLSIFRSPGTFVIDKENSKRLSEFTPSKQNLYIMGNTNWTFALC